MQNTALITDQLLPQLDSAARQALAENGIIKKFKAGDYIVDVGQHFRSTMILLEGQIKVYRPDEEDREFLLYMLEAGQACALSMICEVRNEKSELQAVAQTPVTMLMLPLGLMDQLMLENRSWYHYVLQSYRERFEELLQVVDQIAFQDLDERMLAYLKKSQKQTQSSTLHITHEAIARYLNSSRVVISRLLK